MDWSCLEILALSRILPLGDTCRLVHRLSGAFRCIMPLLARSYLDLGPTAKVDAEELALSLPAPHMILEDSKGIRICLGHSGIYSTWEHRDDSVVSEC